MIEKILEDRSKLVNKAIEKYIPRKYDNKAMEFTFGKPSYAYSPKAATKALSEPIWDLLDRGGKRWRPALFLIILEAFGKDPKKYANLSVLIEVVHNGSLVVDDIEDSSEMRRGKPCTYRIFGIDVAVNVGTAMFFLPLLTLMKSALDKDMKLKAYEIYAQELINIHLGQGMDIIWHRGEDDKIKEEEYLQMCAYKTGTLARMAAKLAALLANQNDNVIEKMGKLAESIGVGFQIHDDILNVEPMGKWGKEIGEDIHEGKRSLMVIRTLQKADGGDRKRLLRILNLHTRDQALIKEAIDIMRKYDSINYARAYSKKLVQDAWDDVSDLIPNNKAKDTLKSFVDFLVNREY
jgi:geranylgeranyl pyrophosphate synthase